MMYTSKRICLWGPRYFKQLIALKKRKAAVQCGLMWYRSTLTFHLPFSLIFLIFLLRNKSFVEPLLFVSYTDIIIDTRSCFKNSTQHNLVNWRSFLLNNLIFLLFAKQNKKKKSFQLCTNKFIFCRLNRQNTIFLAFIKNRDVVTS